MEKQVEGYEKSPIWPQKLPKFQLVNSISLRNSCIFITR